MNLKKLISEMRPIDIEIDWDGTTGKYSQTDFLFHEGENQDITIDLDVYCEREIEKATYDTPESFEVVKTQISIDNIRVYDIKEGERIVLTDAQYLELETAIKNNIRL